ncbi:MAG: hypothetical protein KAR20_17270, partial [Candidatus Heimdallarchaeota archaeon]|nr:hypothetical protein [Candidatus Heimdallarchaeota archaeon]
RQTVSIRTYIHYVQLEIKISFTIRIENPSLLISENELLSKSFKAIFGIVRWMYRSSLKDYN